MQPVPVERSVNSRGVLSSGSFGMSVGDEAHVFGILRNTLYANKELAVLREYSTNAWDEHRDAGIPDVPIRVSLPTEFVPELVVRDFGRGLSEEDVYEVYAKYGASTKRGSNVTVGFLGIGSKSAFCYSDTFTVTSFHRGVRSVYVAVIDESGVGRVEKLHEEPLAEGDETGVEIKVPVDPRDVPAFHREAAFLYPHFRPIPDVNLAVKPHPTRKEATNGYIIDLATTDREKPWAAVMGCVPYRLDLSKVEDELEVAGLTAIARGVRGVLRFDIGAISVSASREEVEYTARTKEAVVRALRALVDELVADLEAALTDPATTDWEKRLATRGFYGSCGLPVQPKHKEWVSRTAHLYSHNQLKGAGGDWLVDPDGRAITDAPRTFRLHGLRFRRNRHGEESGTRVQRPMEWGVIEVEPGAHLYLRDTEHSLRSYDIGVFARVVVPEGDRDLAEVEVELRERVARAGLGGLPIDRLSSLPRHERPKLPKVPRPKMASAKHASTHFVLRDVVRDHIPYSANWEVVERAPTDQDVRVVLSHFDAVGVSKFYHRVLVDRRIVALLGGTFPPVYGHKTTAKRPVSTTNLAGADYPTWRDAEVRRLLDANAEVRRKVDDLRWVKLWSRYRDGDSYVNSRCALAHARATLPEDHPLCRLFTRHAEAMESFGRIPDREREVIRILLGEDVPEWQRHKVAAPGGIEWEADRLLAALHARYPLLRSDLGGPGVGVFADAARCVAWLDYLNLVDRTSA